MHVATLSLKQHGLVVSLLAALWATGCGGSFSGGGAGGSGATSGAGGSGATSGAGGSGAGSACDVGCPLILCEGTSVIHPGDCCPTCEPGGGSGGVSNGGSAGSCAQVGCPAIACAVGYKYVYQPGECCPTCVPDGNGGSGGGVDCALVDCSAPDCALGYVAQLEPDACCPVCVPNTVCTKGQQGYNKLRGKLLAQPGALACKVDKDCSLLAGNGYCGDVCSDVPVNAAAAQSIDSQLNSFAKDNCSTCPLLIPPCPFPSPPVCIQGQCTIERYTPAE